MKTKTNKSIIEDMLEIIKYAVKLGLANGFSGVPSFDNLRNKSASASYIKVKVNQIKTEDFRFWNIQELTEKATDDVKKGLYSDSVKELIEYLQTVKL